MEDDRLDALALAVEWAVERGSSLTETVNAATRFLAFLRADEIVEPGEVVALKTA